MFNRIHTWYYVTTIEDGLCRDLVYFIGICNWRVFGQMYLLSSALGGNQLIVCPFVWYHLGRHIN